MHAQLLNPPPAEVVERIRTLVAAERSAVLALCSPEGPRCFQMAVALSPADWRLWMATAPGNKLSLVRQNPQGCVFFSTARNEASDPQTAATLELHGRLEEVLGPEAEVVRRALAERHPVLEDFFYHPTTVMLQLPVQRVVLTERFHDVVVIEGSAAGLHEGFALPPSLG